MAADLGNLESLRINDPREQATQPEATLASLPEDLWRRIAGYVAPRDSARNLLVASGRSSSLRGALLADIERTERALYGLTRLDQFQPPASPMATLTRVYLRVS